MEQGGPGAPARGSSMRRRGGGVMGSRRWRFASVGVVVCLLLFPLALAAQVDADTYQRENYVLAPDGTLLIVTQPSDDNAGLVRRSSGGIDSTIVLPNAILSLG